ncbi:MAG: hypothetical protein VKK04_15020 [Synechococcales bacterium]|nr:hypothetical protein [Synechococcales bacterium]
MSTSTPITPKAQNPTKGSVTPQNLSFRAVSSEQFVESIGVVTHFTYYDTPYGDFEQVKSALNFLGVQHIRDGVKFDQPENLRRLREIDAMGIKLTYVFPYKTDSVQERLRSVKTLGDVVVAIEGPNETDIFEFEYKGQTFPYGTQSIMRDIFTAVNRDPELKDIPVIQASLGHPWNSADDLGDLSRYADYGNSHNYFSYGKPPGEVITSSHINKDAALVSPGLPLISTEGGYHTASNINSGHLGLPDDIHARYQMRYLLEQFTAGYERSFIYQLFDEGPDPANTNRQYNFGLFEVDGTPKPAAKGIANMITLLEDSAGSTPFATRSLNFELQGVADPDNSLLLQKKDGRFYLVVWNDFDNWNEKTDKPIYHPSTPVTLKINENVSRIRTFSPLTNGVNPLQTYSGKNTINLQVPDHPLIVEITPNSPASKAPGKTNPIVPKENVKDTLVLATAIDPVGKESKPQPSPAPVDQGNTPIPSSGRPTGKSDVSTASQPLLFEAEALELRGYRVEAIGGSGASGGKHISLKGVAGGKGAASGIFNGDAGTYQLKVHYFDENDGQASARIAIGGKSRNLSFNKDLPSDWARPASRTSTVVHDAVNLQRGDRFSITSQVNGDEFARIDAIEFIPLKATASTSGPAPQATPRLTPRPASGGTIAPEVVSSGSSPRIDIGAIARLDLTALTPYGGRTQNKALQTTFSPGGTAVRMQGNGWRKLDINYTITPETMLKLEFRSNAEGEIHAIGFDTDNRVNSRDQKTSFRLFGVQDWGIGDFANYLAQDGWQTVEIPVGDYFTGKMNYLTFANDFDVANPNAISEFRNVMLYEQAESLGGSSALAETTSADAMANTLVSALPSSPEAIAV